MCPSNIPTVGASTDIDYDDKIVLKQKYNVILPFWYLDILSEESQLQSLRESWDTFCLISFVYKGPLP